jgi:hypothetical protein
MGVTGWKPSVLQQLGDWSVVGCILQDSVFRATVVVYVVVAVVVIVVVVALWLVIIVALG